MADAADDPRAAPFTYRTAMDHGTSAVVTVAGELDVVTSPRLEAALLELVEGGIRRLVLDVRGLTFVDSTGLRGLVMVMRARDDMELVLRSVPERLGTLLSITGLDAVFTLE